MVAVNAPTDRSTPSAFGHFLKRLRTSSALTQEELAERASVSARLISDLERGLIRRPRRDTIRLLADALGLTGGPRDVFTALARGSTVSDVEPPSLPVLARPSLPRPPTPLVGRSHEITEALSLLADRHVQLLTLTGPGGVGKTRLAIEIATRISGVFADTTYFVDLTPVRAPDLVLERIVHILALPPASGQPLHLQLTEALQGRHCLLVLDNVEHVLGVAPEIANLLRACPDLTILATSRVPLKIRAEQEYRVDPLALPDLDHLPCAHELGQIPAVDLFLRRGRAAIQDFTLTAENARAVAEITVRLDGLPLAIELAAARLKVLSPNALLARLEHRLSLLTDGPHDLPIRLQAMSATIDWSYDLLSPDHQALLRQLATFVGGFTLDAAEAMTLTEESPSRREFPVSRASLLDVLGVLVDQSLLVTRDGGGGERRFLMLETIREYGLQRLADLGETAGAKTRHAAWCLALAERVEPELTGPVQDQWCTVLDLEHGNLRAALDWAITQRDAATALGLSGSLWRYWQFRGYYPEGRCWIEQALALDEHAVPARRAKACRGGARLAYRQGDLERAEVLSRTALSIDRELGNHEGVAASLGELGLVTQHRGNLVQAATHFEEALTIYRAIGNQDGVGRALNGLGNVACNLGDYQRSAALHTEALTIRRALGDQDGIAFSVCNLAYLAYLDGDLARATTLYREGWTLFQKVGNQARLVESLEDAALISAATGDLERATRLLGAADAQRARIGVPVPALAVHRLDMERNRAAALRQLGPAAFTLAWEDGQQMTLDQALACALHTNPA